MPTKSPGTMVASLARSATSTESVSHTHDAPAPILSRVSSVSTREQSVASPTTSPTPPINTPRLVGALKDKITLENAREK